MIFGAVPISHSDIAAVSPDRIVGRHATLASRGVGTPRRAVEEGAPVVLAGLLGGLLGLPLVAVVVLPGLLHPLLDGRDNTVETIGLLLGLRLPLGGALATVGDLRLVGGVPDVLTPLVVQRDSLAGDTGVVLRDLHEVAVNGGHRQDGAVHEVFERYTEQGLGRGAHGVEVSPDLFEVVQRDDCFLNISDILHNSVVNIKINGLYLGRS